MIRWGSAISTVALLALLFTPNTSAAAKPPLLKLLGGNTREVHVNGDRVNIGFPVELAAGVRVREIGLAVISVRLGRRSELRLKNAFSARIKGPVRDRTALLVIPVNFDPPLTPGTYAIAVVGTGRVGKPPRRRMARLAIKIVVPAATLKPLKPLVIERTLPPLVWWGDPSDEMPPLRLRETSKRSRLTGIDLVQDGAARKGDKTTTAVVTFTDPASIGPGRRGSANYELVGSSFVDPGTVTGSVDVDAAELAAPVSFDYEVRITRSKGLIAIVAFVGVVLGFLVRVFLQRVIDVSRAKHLASDVAWRIENASRSGDETLVKKLREVRNELDPAFDWIVTPSNVEAAIKAAEKTYGEAIADFTKRTLTAVDEQTRLATIVDTRWALPPTLEPEFAKAREALGAAKHDLDRDQVDRARDAQIAAEGQLQRAVVHELGSWKADAEQLVVAIKTEPPPPASIAGTVGEALKRVSDSLGALSDEPDAKLSEVLPLLDEAVRTVNALRRVLWTTEAEANAVRVRVEPEDARLLESALKRLMATASRDATPQQIRKSYRELIETLRDVVLRASADDDAAAELIAQGKYFDALPARDTALGLVATAPPVSASILGFAMDSARPLASVTSPAARVREALPPAQTLRRRAAKMLVVAWFLQWLVTSAIAVGVAYLLFSGDWEGTLQDIAEVFFWAFAIDVSANTLIEEAKTGLKPATTPASSS